MSDFYMRPESYSDVARRLGESFAQSLWIQNGGTGIYVPGMTAIAGFYDVDGKITPGKTEPHQY